MNVFEQFSQHVLTIGGNASELLAAYGLEYKRGKTLDDLRLQIKKGLKRGQGKFEREVMFVSEAIQRVLMVSK